MVVFENGRPKPSDYRRFRIKTLEGQNDVGSLQEILRRRFKRLLAGSGDGASAAESELVAVSANADDANDANALAGETNNVVGETDETDQAARALAGAPDAPDAPANAEGASADAIGDPWAQLPDLLIVDGGRPQLNAAMSVLTELQVGVSAIGIAKEDHGSISTHEEIYLVEQPDPLVLPRGSQGLYLLQRIRDEAHRFAITYHREVRSKRTFKSVLDEIPGIGPKRKQALMKHYGSVRAMSAASVEDLAALDGMTRDAAAKLKEYIGKME